MKVKDILKLKLDEDYEEHSGIRVLDGENYRTDSLVRAVREYSGVNLFNHYYLEPEHINNYLIVITSSRYRSALEAAMFISNRSRHKLKDFRTSSQTCVLVFKKCNRANEWQ